MNEHKILILLALLSFMCSGVVMAETHRIIPAVQEMQVGRGGFTIEFFSYGFLCDRTGK